MSLLDAPELAPYHDEPKQLPSGAPGKHGVLDMSFVRRGGRSVLAHLYRQAPLLVQQALYWDEHLPGLPCVYVITTTGCVIQGDRQDVSVTVGADAMAHVTTQSATKIHQMDANFAAASQRLALAENAYLELLPGPVIPHRHSRFIIHTRATVAESATLLSAELLQPGRKHHGAGELFEFDLYSSTLTASRPDGTPLFTEKLVAEPWRHPIRQAGVMGKFDVFANVTLITPRPHADRIFEQVVPGADARVDCVAGASRLPNDAGLVYKVLGMETEPVKAKVRAFWNLARQQVTGAAIPAARPWGPPLLRTNRMPVPAWLTILSWIFIGIGGLSAALILADIYLLGYREHVKIMEAVWPLTALYAGPLGLLAYFRWGRPMSYRWMRARNRGVPGKPFWAGTAVSATHCGAGCVLGDLIAEWIVFAVGLQLLGFALPVEYPFDYVLALSWGILFQYFVIAPMRHLAFGKGLKLAAKADFLALSTFEVGLFAWMAIMQLVLFPSPHLTTDHAAFWFLMQVGMIIGFATTYPMNWWLIRHGIKEIMLRGAGICRTKGAASPPTSRTARFWTRPTPGPPRISSRASDSRGRFTNAGNSRPRDGPR